MVTLPQAVLYWKTLGNISVRLNPTGNYRFCVRAIMGTL